MRAITRHVPASFANALSANPQPIDVELARDQHAAYGAALEACGVEVTILAAPPELPDCVFVEDTAVVANGVALVTRPGAVSRRGETAAIRNALNRMGQRTYGMYDPDTLDGGDVMRLGTTLYVGRSQRTNASAIATLDQIFGWRGFTVIPIDLPPHVLHLKCVVSPLSPDTILLADGSIPADRFTGANVIRVPVEETYAANAVAIDRHVILADGFPRTLDAVIAAGFTPHPVPTSEVRKADGSLTCQSILVPE